MPALIQNITITRVGMDPNAQLTPEQRYPGGHVCNIFPEQSALLERAAQELGIEIKYGTANNAAHEGVVGVYVAKYEPDPALLLEKFEMLKIEAWKAKQNGGTGHETESPAAPGVSPKPRRRAHRAQRTVLSRTRHRPAHRRGPVA